MKVLFATISGPIIETVVQVPQDRKENINFPQSIDNDDRMRTSKIILTSVVKKG